MIATNIWVGLKFDNSTESTRLYAELFCKKLPKDMAATINKEGVCQFDGVDFRFFRFAEMLVGFGAPLIMHTSDEGPHELDRLFIDHSYWVERVGTIFDTWSLEEKPKIYLMEDLVL